MKNKLTITYKILIILVFIAIAIINYFFASPVIGRPQCTHDTLIGILEIAARWLEYIGLLGGIIFVIVSKYKDKKYYKGMKIIILLALVIPFILSTSSYFIEKYDQNNNNCTIKETEWKSINTQNN